MLLYKMRNVLEAAGVKAFWKLEAGVTRGPVPEEDQSQDHSQERIRKLQQELHRSRQEIKSKNQKLARLRKQRDQQKQQRQKSPVQNQKQTPKRAPKQGARDQIDPSQFGATLPIPPRDMGPITQARDIKGYLRQGSSIKSRLLRYAGVTPTSSILDIGAGPGRVARHFVDFVEPPGRYVGMDIEKPNMDWCEENIAAANPAFSFFHQNVYNGLYNPQGEYSASEYRFPFEDGSFDLIFLTSIFTHLVPEDARNYLRQISRLLKPDGVCFCTWFLLGHDLGVKYMGPHSKEARVGFGFRYLLEMLEESGLTFAQEPALGSWRGQKPPHRNGDAGGQDILLLRRGTEEKHLPSRHGAPDLPKSDPSELEEATGTVRMFDPVSNSVTVQDDEGEKTFGVPAEAELRINGQGIDSAALRPGQQATIRFVRDGRGAVARTVHATDQPRILNNRMPRVAGTLQALDQERGLVTLIAGNTVRTFELDTQKVEVRPAESKEEQISLDDLEIGQGVFVEQARGKRIITSLSQE